MLDSIPFDTKVLACARLCHRQGPDVPPGHTPHHELVCGESLLESAGTQKGPHDAAPHVQKRAERVAHRRRDAADVHEAPRAMVGDETLQEANVRRWGALVANWFWAGHAARSGTRQRGQSITWPDESYRNTWPAHCIGDKTTRRAKRVGRKLGAATGRPWDDPVQAMCTELVPSAAWREVTQDTGRWHTLKPFFVARSFQG